MKILFMGTPEFAVPCLKEVYKSQHDVVAVITQPDRPRGRGKKVLPPPVKKEAELLGIEVYQPLNIKNSNFIKELKKIDFDCIVVVAYGQILPKSILDLPPKGCINVHASLLPKYRGAAPINWAILNGETKTGITTMYMDEGLDTGDMILKNEIHIDSCTTAGELHDKLSELGAQTLIKTLELVEINKAPRTLQNNKESSYATILDKGMGCIDWNNSANEIHNKVRGLNPWPTAYTRYKGEKIKIWKSKVIDKSCIAENGVIINVDSLGISVCTENKILLLEEIQFPNNRRMTVSEYIRGNIIEEGIKLGE